MVDSRKTSMASSVGKGPSNHSPESSRVLDMVMAAEVKPTTTSMLPQFPSHPTEYFFGLRDTSELLRMQSPLQRRIRKCLHSTFFEYFMALIILGNFFLIIVETDHLAQEENDTSPTWITFVSWIILIIFVIELVFRLYSEECRFFHDPWNFFDFTIITGDLFLSGLSLLLDNHIPVSVLRVLRLSKVARVSKLFRVFPELRVMMVGLMSAFRAMLWGTVLLFIALLVLSVIAVQIIHPLNRDVAKTGRQLLE